MGRNKCSIHSHIADVSSGYVQLSQPVGIETTGRRVLWEYLPPDLRPLSGIRKWELDDEPKSPQERGVQSALHVRGQNSQPTISLHSLQQIAHFNVCVTIVAVFN